VRAPLKDGVEILLEKELIELNENIRYNYV